MLHELPHGLRGAIRFTARIAFFLLICSGETWPVLEGSVLLFRLCWSKKWEDQSDEKVKVLNSDLKGHLVTIETISKQTLSENGKLETD